MHHSAFKVVHAWLGQVRNTCPIPIDCPALSCRVVYTAWKTLDNS